MMRLHHVRLLVRDMDASIRFYRDLLGFQLKWGEAAIGYASFTGGYGADLSLFARQGQPEATSMPQPGDRLLLSVEVDDLDHELERLRGQGVAIVAGPRDEPSWGLRVAYIRDPDGNLLELMRQLPQAAWSPWLRQADDRYT